MYSLTNEAYPQINYSPNRVWWQMAYLWASSPGKNLWLVRFGTEGFYISSNGNWHVLYMC